MTLSKTCMCVCIHYSDYSDCLTVYGRTLISTNNIVFSSDPGPLDSTRSRGKKETKKITQLLKGDV